MTTHLIDPPLLATLRRASRQVEALRLQADAIERFAQGEAVPLQIMPGDKVDLDTGVVIRANREVADA